MDKAPESEIIGIAEAGLMLSVEGQEQIALGLRSRWLRLFWRWSIGRATSA